MVPVVLKEWVVFHTMPKISSTLNFGGFMDARGGVAFCDLCWFSVSMLVMFVVWTYENLNQWRIHWCPLDHNPWMYWCLCFLFSSSPEGCKVLSQPFLRTTSARLTRKGGGVEWICCLCFRFAFRWFSGAGKGEIFAVPGVPGVFSLVYLATVAWFDPFSYIVFLFFPPLSSRHWSRRPVF